KCETIMDQLHALTAFVAVAEENGFAAGARRLGLSGPSVTRLVNGLEAHLGAQLLHRTTRTVSLTEVGQRYLADAKRILGDLEEADRTVAGLHAAPKGRVSVTASLIFGRKIVAPALFDAMDLYPEISISTLFVDRVTHLADEGLDIAVRIAELPDSSMIAARVGAVRRVLCASPGYLDRWGRPETPKALEAHRLIGFASSAATGAWVLAQGGKTQVLKVDARLLTNTADVAIGAALAGRGITRVLSYQVDDEVAAGRLELVLPDYTPPAVPVHVVHRETGQVPARVRAVVDHLVGALRLHPSLRQRG
ncbi:MAG: LysR family transcriptional regulator, partial [Pseudomonadota bacterium]